VNTDRIPEMVRKAGAQERDRWLRRQAMQIVVQLPEEDAEALAVLDHARRLLRQA
jgi:hypothetical protein